MQGAGSGVRKHGGRKWKGDGSLRGRRTEVAAISSSGAGKPVMTHAQEVMLASKRPSQLYIFALAELPVCGHTHPDLPTHI